MKKTLTALIAVLTAAVAAAGDVPVYFCSQGPDCYADGTVVQDGEIYALVWSRTNGVGQVVSQFALDAKCAVCDPDNHAVVARAPIAKGGRCPPNVYLLDEQQAALAETGVFNVYLLDTRTRADEGGATSVGFGAGRSISCNGYEQVDATVSVGGATQRVKSGTDGTTDQSVVVSGRNAVATAVPADARTLRETAVLKDGGLFYVEVADTETYIRYALEGRVKPGEAGVNLANGVNGAGGDGRIVLSGDATKYQFFKVVRSDFKAQEGGQGQ